MKGLDEGENEAESSNYMRKEKQTPSSHSGQWSTESDSKEQGQLYE